MGDSGAGQSRTTLKDIASRVGLSVNTVSRALNDMPGVSGTTRALVKAEAERVGYIPNVYARSLVLGSRKTIAMLVTNISNPFFADLISEVELRAIEAGYTLLLLLSDESYGREEDAITAVLRSGVDGVLAVPASRRPNSFAALVRRNVPLVLMCREVPGLNVDVFSNDNETGMYLTTSAVLERGAHDVMLVEEELPISTIDYRIAGFRRAMEDHGVPFDPSRIAFIPPRRSAYTALPWQTEDSYLISKDLLARGRRPDAFVLGNDYFALGLYAALREYHLRVPDDVMVAGWGDYPFARYLDPPLATLSLPSRELARRAFQRLIDKIEGTADGERATVFLGTEVITRQSLRSRATQEGKTPMTNLGVIPPSVVVQAR